VHNEAVDEADALAQVQRFLSYLPRSVFHTAPVLPATDDPDRADDWLKDAIPRDRRATAALVRKLQQCHAETSFNTLRSVLMALGRIGDPAAAPALAEFLRKPGVRGHRDTGTQPVSVESAQFSRAMIELFAAAALFRCGDSEGLAREILMAYLDDWRGIFVRFAGYTLEGR